MAVELMAPAATFSVSGDAVVTATGKGNAADIGDGHPKDSTHKQPNKVDVDSLYPTGSVNSTPGTKELPKENDNGQSSGGVDYTLQFPDFDSIGQFSDSDSGIGIDVKGSPSPPEYISVRLSNLNSKDLPREFMVKNDKLTIAVAADNITLTGDRDELQSLIDRGTGKPVLETNRVSVSVNNDFLMKITNADESFQLRTEGTSFSLTTTDQNHKKKFDMNLTTDGTHEERKETQEDTQSQNSLDHFLLSVRCSGLA